MREAKASLILFLYEFILFKLKTGLIDFFNNS